MIYKFYSFLKFGGRNVFLLTRNSAQVAPNQFDQLRVTRTHFSVYLSFLKT